MKILIITYEFMNVLLLETLEKSHFYLIKVWLDDFMVSSNSKNLWEHEADLTSPVHIFYAEMSSP